MSQPIVPGGEVVVYEKPCGGVRLDVRPEGETVWLSLNQMAKLFGRDTSVIGTHLRSVYASGELERGATAANNAVVRFEGGRQVTRQVEHFNLDAVLSVGSGIWAVAHNPRYAPAGVRMSSHASPDGHTERTR